MKTLILALFLISTQVSAWYGPGPGWGPGWGMGWGMGYPGYGYMYPPIQYPAFNYQQTVVVQQPPPPPQVIERVIEPPPRVIERVIEPPPRIIEREVCNDECERLRGYFRKH